MVNFFKSPLTFVQVGFSLLEPRFHLFLPVGDFFRFLSQIGLSVGNFLLTLLKKGLPLIKFLFAGFQLLAEVDVALLDKVFIANLESLCDLW